MLCADGESGAEVVAAARGREQARIVFDSARDMLRANPEFCEKFGLTVLQHTIEHRASASVMRPVSAQGKNLDGCLPYFACADELWAHRNRDVVDAMERGVDKRETNSLLWSIGHAGTNQACVGYEMHCLATALLNKELKDEKTFCAIYSAEGLDWRTEDGWRAANPNWNVSVFPDLTAEAAERAALTPSLQASFRARNCCEWLNADMTWVDPAKIAACKIKGLKQSDLRFYRTGERGVDRADALRPFSLGLDLASKQDLAAVIDLCITLENGVEHYYAFGKYYLPEDTVKASPNAQYRSWAARKILTVFPGPTNDLQAIQNDITHAEYRLVLGAYDSWQAEQLIGNLKTLNGEILRYKPEGQQRFELEMVEFPKNTKTYSPMMDFLSALILEGRFHFAAEDEILSWAFSNVVCHRDLNENIFPRKASADRKIDPVVALLYALKAALVEGGAAMRKTPPRFVIEVWDSK